MTKNERILVDALSQITGILKGCHWRDSRETFCRKVDSLNRVCRRTARQTSGLVLKRKNEKARAAALLRAKEDAKLEIEAMKIHRTYFPVRK
jgi:hypothetical protein